jgi:hypothetical protein
MAYITQKDGYWFINLIDELETRDLYLFTFDYLGEFVSSTTGNFTKSIGATELLTWMNDDQEKSLENAVKEVQLDYPFNLPKEVLTNYDLSRGTDLSSTTIAPEGWIFERWTTVGSANNIPVEDSTPHYIHLVFVDDQEKERYLRMEASSITKDLVWRNADKIPVHAGDKIAMSFDWRFTNNPGGSGHFHYIMAQIRLYGDDGTTWSLNGISGSGFTAGSDKPKWVQSDVDFITNNQFIYYDGELSDELTEWQSVNVTSTPMPVKGRVEVYLKHNVNTNARGKDFAAISFDYIPYIAGTYQKYKGNQYKVNQVLDTAQVIQDEAGISDSIKYLFKWALLKVSGSNELYTGSVTVTAPNIISLATSSGYKNHLFTVGKKITLSGVNTGYYTIGAINYSVVGDRTALTIKENTLTSETATITISELIFALANSFYAANVFPDGPPDETYYHPYGHLQALGVWNQNNRVMSKFEGSVDHLDTDSDIPDISHKYFLTDPDQSTNGKIFMCLHMRNNLHDVESEIFLHEVFDENILKVYPEPEFKYIT